jgi:hypothetical protein
MNKYWPNLEEYKSISNEERDRHKSLLILLRKASLIALLIVGFIYVYNEAFSAVIACIGMCSGGVGFLSSVVFEVLFVS